MKINKQLFEDVLSSKLKGIFVLRNGDKYLSADLRRNYNTYKATHPYTLTFRSYTPKGAFRVSGTSEFDIIDFIFNTNMKENELKITIPEGQEIDWQESAKQEKIVFKKKDTKPRSWEEYCENNEDKQVWFVKENSDIGSCHLMNRSINEDKNTLPSKELAESFRAMMQLISVRQEWIHKWSIDSGMIDDWEPDWNVANSKWCIYTVKSNLKIYENEACARPLSFPTKEMAEDFMNCFKDLLEIAKPLI